jgi:tripartite-type tricarboxylate transporter receptor subunit TctC
MNCLRKLFFIGAVLLGFTLPALSDDYPSKPIHIMVATAAGGPTDLAARIIGKYITQYSGQPVVVENKPGGGGTQALGETAKANPDGYTLSFCAAGEVVIHPFLYKDLSFNPLKDVVPVAQAAEAPQVLVISSKVPATNLREFIDYAKAHPGEINFGSSGTGGTPHLGALRFAKLAGVQITHVPYRGAPLATADLIAGRIQMMHITPLPVVGPAKAGLVRILAIAQPNHSPALPDVPTSAEAGLPGYETSLWFGLFAPRGTPKPVVDKIYGWVREMDKDPQYRKQLADIFFDASVKSPEAFQAKIDKEAPEWERDVHDFGLSIE